MLLELSDDRYLQSAIDPQIDSISNYIAIKSYSNYNQFFVHSQTTFSLSPSPSLSLARSHLFQMDDKPVTVSVAKCVLVLVDAIIEPFFPALGKFQYPYLESLLSRKHDWSDNNNSNVSNNSMNKNHDNGSNSYSNSNKYNASNAKTNNTAIWAEMLTPFKNLLMCEQVYFSMKYIDNNNSSSVSGKVSRIHSPKHNVAQQPILYCTALHFTLLYHDVMCHTVPTAMYFTVHSKELMPKLIP